MYVTHPFPLILAKVGSLRELAILAPYFDDAAALGKLGVIMALLGDQSFSPQPESTMHLYNVNIFSTIHKGIRTEVALRTSAM